MLKPGPWLVYAQHECLYTTGPCHAGDHIIAAMNLKSCPKCHQPCDLLHRDTWAKVIVRKISDRVWYKPSTWHDHHLEYKSKGHLESAGYNYRNHMINAMKSP